jgi:aspartate ammonia-lyase
MNRIEEDFIGKKEIDNDRYYGIQSLRALENFSISKNVIHPLLVKNIALIKKAAAVVNQENGDLKNNIAEAIIQAAEELVDHKFDQDIIVDAIQGGAGTSINMNVNEIIANRAAELLNEEKGKYSLVHPNNHVNMSQSTNDVIPTAIKMGTISLLKEALIELESLRKAFEEKAIEFDEVIKMGRTQLQDAVPIRLGQEFEAYQAVVSRDIDRFKSVIEKLKIVNLGGTAIGTGINASQDYINKIVETLNKYFDFDLIQAVNLIDCTQNNDVFMEASSILKISAVNLSKIANDLRLLSSGPKTGLNEISLPAVQPGSSIMPGKINPVIPEVVNQIAFQIVGNDQTITMAVEAGQLELNVMMPVISFNLFQSIEILKNGIFTFYDKAIKGINANKLICKQHVENSVGTITALSPYLGYEKSSQIAKKALANNKNIREIIVSEYDISKEKLDNILDFYEMTKSEKDKNKNS